MKRHLAQNKAYLKYRNAWHQISGQLKTHDTNLVFNQNQIWIFQSQLNLDP